MKKSVKILIIILILVILGLVTFIVADKVINNKRENKDENIIVSENEANNSYENEINNIQKFTNNTINSTKNEVNIVAQSQSANILSTEEALALGKEKYEVANNCYWSGVEANYGDVIYDIDESGNPYYMITNIDEIKSILINNAFSDFCNEKRIKEKNGKYYIVAAGRGSDISYLGNELKVDNITENKIEFTSIEKYCANEADWGMYSDASEVKDITTKEYKFVIVKEDNSWKIDEFTLPD